jgi:hypothetical protein
MNNLVRMDQLLVETKFQDQSGKRGIFIRQHGANSGAYICRHDNGHETTYAGCAEVFPEDDETDGAA